MPADTTEIVAEHSTRLQPSINLHAPVTAFMLIQLLWYPNNPMYYPGGMKARVSPVQWIDRSLIEYCPHSGFAPAGDRIQNHKQWPLH